MMKKLIIAMLMSFCLVSGVFALSATAGKSTANRTTTIVQQSTTQSSTPKQAGQQVAGQTPESLRSDAFYKVKIGYDTFNRAGLLVKREGMSNESLKAAIELYAQAGQLFQEAYNVLNYLGKDYVSQQDIDGTKQSMDACLESIANAKKMIADNTKK